MQALAGRKAKVDAIGAIGIVENMPGPHAQRPGDIVTSMSGQTIEIINTDAEGRLVLADVCWYIQDKYKPKFMIDLATLTGAILVALGQEHAGLFSNDDELSDKLLAAGKATGEKLWRMPLGPAYDKIIDSKFADVKNSGGRHARLDHRGAFHPALRQQRAVGASRHRRNGHGLALERHQPELGLGLGRAALGPARRRQLRGALSARGGEGATEIWFYHLQSQPLARALPAILVKATERGWPVVVQTVDDLRLKALDDLLWTFDKTSFLPHATVRDPNAAAQPVLLTTDVGNANAAKLRVYVEGAEVALEAECDAYERVILMFDGANEAELEAARVQWARLKRDGGTLAYWKQSEAGRWERTA